MFIGLAFLLNAAAAAASLASPPPELIGTWEVAHASVNMNDQPHWNYRPEDPGLIGRELVVAADQVRFANWKETHCEPATWKQESSSWSGLTDDVFLGPKSPSTPADWRIKSPSKAKVPLHRPCWGAKTWQKASWLVTVDPNRAIMELDFDTVLFLVRRTADAKPQPSFSCTKAATTTEKTICESFALFTPADVFFGRVEQVRIVRQAALDAAFAAHPERFPRGAPRVPLPPGQVSINPLTSSAVSLDSPSAENGPQPEADSTLHLTSALAGLGRGPERAAADASPRSQSRAPRVTPAAFPS